MKLSLALFPLLLFGAAGPAWGACSASATDVAFGTYYPYAPSPLDFNGTITVTCTASSGTSPIVIALDVGSVIAGGSSYAERNMAMQLNYLGFNLYTSAARNTVWGDGTGGTQTITAPASLASAGGTATFTVYGRVRVGQRRYASPGTYLDVITVTLTY